MILTRSQVHYRDKARRQFDHCPTQMLRRYAKMWQMENEAERRCKAVQMEMVRVIGNIATKYANSAIGDKYFEVAGVIEVSG